MRRRLIQKHEPKWAFLQPVVIPDIADPDQDYLVRWRLIHTPYGGIYLHKILLPDNDVNLHDHPWDFVSIVLRGGYEETWQSWFDWFVPEPKLEYSRKMFSVHKMNKYDFHKISKLTKVPTWTLIFAGSKTKDWGYKVEDSWISHHEYQWQQYNETHH